MGSESRLRLHGLWVGVGWIWLALIVYYSVIPAPPKPLDIPYDDKLYHFAAYFVLMFWFCLIYRDRVQRLRWGVFFTFVGVALEVVQALGPVRWFEVADMVADLLGVLAAWLLALTPLGGFLFGLERTIIRRQA